MSTVIVESPSKAKTINKYLGKEYKVLASFGHIRDLPSKNGSVRPEENFAMDYEISEGSERHVKAIADAVKKGGDVYLASDPDREGEAIAWHIVEALKERKAPAKGQKVQRVSFNAITRNAVREAFNHPRDIDMDLVNAQQARRALDYLVGFNLSPVLWRKLPGSRSAGRVQSVALRLICDREDEIDAFVTQEYWTIKGEFVTGSNAVVNALLTHLQGEKLDKFSLGNEAAAVAAVTQLQGKKFAVSDIERKQAKRNPYAPFTTSTLQQEASHKLGFGASRTMSLAQKLYEGVEVEGETVGLITYMRTDGVTVAPEAVQATRQLIQKQFGDKYLPSSPRVYKSKAKNAQEAHEAIRPTNVELTPDRVRNVLDKDLFRLYELIWKRMVASQMEAAVLDQVAITISTPAKDAFRATGSTIAFDGFYKLYLESREDEDEEGEQRLPPVKEGEAMTARQVMPEQHFTQPPPRYSEAGLVKRMEELGIGRPSTYASIISVLQDRGYVKLDKKRFIPEQRGRIVTAFLTSFFKKYVEYDFTAHLEEELDFVSDGKMDWKQLLKGFWGDFSTTVQQVSRHEAADIISTLDMLLERSLFTPGADGNVSRVCPSCSEGTLNLRMGKFGPFIACTNYPTCKYTRQIAESNGEGGDNEVAAASTEPRLIGKHPVSMQDVTLRKGPYGYYIQLGEAVDKKDKPKRMSLPKGVEPDQVNLEQALSLLSLPRDIGAHPETGKKITAGLGRFGPYILHDGQYTSLKGDDNVLTIGINRAVTLIAEKGKKGAAVEPIKVLGNHPDDDKPVAIYEGRYGPYVKHGKINATLPKNADIRAFTLEEALMLIKAKAEKDGGGAPAKKTAARAKKAPAEGGAKKKAMPKKKAAKK